MRFFGGGSVHKERMLSGGNQVGKSTVGSFEMALHLTGQYKRFAPWWTGKTFDRPVRCWAAGTTGVVTRDVIQRKLFGSLVREPGASLTESFGLGTGMLPGKSIHSITQKSGLPNADNRVGNGSSHISGGYSKLVPKSFEQGRESFTGETLDVVWLDEEPSQDVYSECLTRTITTGGVLYITSTPMLGMTSLVPRVHRKGSKMSKLLVTVGWNAAPHLGRLRRLDKASCSAYQEYELEARTMGVPGEIGVAPDYPLAVNLRMRAI